MYSLEKEERPLIDIIIKWRRLERRCWKTLLLAKEKEAELKDIEIFLSLREMLIENAAAEAATVAKSSSKQQELTKDQ